ncbi:lysine-rich coiled-coil protein 1 [Gastrophryne carolinensis]
MASEGAIVPQLAESIVQSCPSPASSCSLPMAGGELSNSAQPTISPCHTDFDLDEKTKKELFTDTFCRVCGAVLQFESHRNAHYEGKKHAQKVRLYIQNKELEEMAYKKNKEDRGSPQVEQGLTQDKDKFCSLCNMVFSSPVVAQSHYVGKIHAKKVKQLCVDQNDSIAEASNPLPTPQADKAVPPVAESSPDVSVEKPKQLEAASSEPPATADNNEIDLSDPNKYCKLCCATFNKPMVAQQHYSGKKHARNELRRKLMEEMEDTGVPMVSAASTGVYVCPICSITLTSIEMYQSHMQGNKHQIKENIVSNLIKTTKKTYDSFENELQDYMKIQKARGLAPKTQFRQDRDPHDDLEDAEPTPPHPIPSPAAPHPIPSPAAPHKYFGHHPMPYPAYNPLHSAGPRMAGWGQPYRLPKPAMRMPMKAAPHRKRRPSSSSDSSDSSSDESSGSYKKEKRYKREHRNKEQKHSKSLRENGSESKKQKADEGDSGKEDIEKDKKVDDAPGDKSKHKKDKKKKSEIPADKESKKHKKAKKVEDQRTEDEILWDESILGF